MTSFEDIYNAFFEKMESDQRFFNYFDLTEEESMALARERAHTYLKESIAVILRRCDTDTGIDFTNYNDELEMFNFDLTPDEIDMIASLMYEQEYKRQYSRLKVFDIQHIPSTLNVFSPSNERKTVRALFQDIHYENLTILDNYNAKDRNTHNSKTIDYDSYADE